MIFVEVLAILDLSLCNVAGGDYGAGPPLESREFFWAWRVAFGGEVLELAGAALVGGRSFTLLLRVESAGGP